MYASIRRRATCLAALALALAANISHAHASSSPLEYDTVTLTVESYELPAKIPRGWTLELVTGAMVSPRVITFHPAGDLFAGSRSGSVYRLAPPYTHPEVLVQLDDYPHSVAFRDGEILIARTRGVYRAPYVPGQARVAPSDVMLLAALPGGGGHNSRTVRVGRDKRIYASLGISGNCTEQYIGEGYPFDDWRGGVLVLDETGSEPRWKPFASGLRNPVGFAWNPRTGVAYASNNGPDHLGFELPPEIFARLAPGSFHGMPWFQWDGVRMKRDTCASGDPPRPLEETTSPAATFPARSAPMDVVFVPNHALTPALEGDAVVAIHGSWGTSPTGGAGGDPSTRREPKISIVRFEGGEPVRVDDLVTGFQLPDGRRWARPVGVAIGPDGALYFTSDAGIQGLYRLRAR